MTASEKREKAVELIRSRLRKNDYTQGDRRSYVFGYPDNKAGNTSQAGYGDCSSTVRACIKAAAGIDIGGNTSAQINNRRNGIIVHEPSNGVPDESKYLPGDCLYFKGNNSHPLGVGHVEMYTGKNRCTGHGSGKGPNDHDLKSYCASRQKSGKGLFMVIRWINGDDEIRNGVTVKDGTWNLRALPNTDAEIVSKVSGKTVLKRIESDWIPVEHNGCTAWISNNGVEEKA